MSFGLCQVTHKLCLCRRCQVHCPLLPNFSAWKWFKARGMPSSNGTDWAINLRPLFCTCTIHHYLAHGWSLLQKKCMRFVEAMSQWPICENWKWLTKIDQDMGPNSTYILHHFAIFCRRLLWPASLYLGETWRGCAALGVKLGNPVLAYKLWYSGSSPECWLREVEPNHYINCQ